jgi:hypothetical protein
MTCSETGKGCRCSRYCLVVGAGLNIVVGVGRQHPEGRVSPWRLVAAAVAATAPVVSRVGCMRRARHSLVRFEKLPRGARLRRVVQGIERAAFLR